MIQIPLLGTISKDEYDLIVKANDIELRECRRLGIDIYPQYMLAFRNNQRTIQRQ